LKTFGEDKFKFEDFM